MFVSTVMKELKIHRNNVLDQIKEDRKMPKINGGKSVGGNDICSV